MINQLQFTFTENVAKLIQYIFSQGYSCTLGEAWRPQKVAMHYAEEGIGVVSSLHILRLAIDLNLFKDGKYLPLTEAHKPFGDYWESLNPNNRWGGRYDDGNHYEMLPRARE